MKLGITGKCGILSSALLCGSFAFAADYYVSTAGLDTNDGLSTESAFATIDKAVSTAVAGDTIYVAAGTYTTTTQYGPNLVATMIGLGNTRNDVVIESSGAYRTLRTASTAVVTNLTIIGNTLWKADKGGAVEMSGGTIEDCVIKNGTAYANSSSLAGGNIYMSAGLVSNCEIIGGSATNRGGNVYLDGGTISNCTVKGGYSSRSGGNIFGYKGLVTHSSILNGKSEEDGGNLRLYGSTVKIADSTIQDGTVVKSDKKGANVYMDGSTSLTRCHLIGGSNENSYNSSSVCVASGTAVVEDCLIEQSNCGGVLLNGTCYLYNTTIVKNKKYGIWAWNANKNLHNVVLYGNVDDTGANADYSGNLPSDSSVVSLAVTSGGRFKEGDCSNGVVLLSDTSSFVDYENGNYRPVKGSALVDAGKADSRVGASTTDLDGNTRVVEQIDIGCYEYQSEEFSVSFSMTYEDDDHAPCAVSFTAVPLNAEGEVSYTYDFGDGSTPETTTEEVYSHTYATNGVYTVSLTAANGAATASMTREQYVTVYGDVVWVNPSATPVKPYNTRETGVKTIDEALNVHASKGSGTICIAPARYTTSWQYGINKPYIVRGMGETPEEVVISNTATAKSSDTYRRVFEITSADARIENLTMEGGQVYNNRGGNLRMTAGVVSNCVIRGGLATTTSSGNGSGGAVEIAGTAFLTHCVVTNNILVGATSSDAYRGGAGVYFCYNSKSMKMSNCLVAFNTYKPGTDSSTDEAIVKTGAAGIQFGGGNEGVVVENCSVVSNVVEGAVADDSAGAYCTSWSVTFRNCVFAGNYETAKQKMTSVKFGDHVSASRCVTDDVVINSNCYLGDRAAMFKNFEGGDFTPKPGNALANKGATPSYVAAVDLAGNPRIFGKAIDIGCYEVQRDSGFIVRIR